MSDDPIYAQWIERRRSATPSPDLADRVMAVLESEEGQPRLSVRLASRIDGSRLVRWAACVAALLLGCLPFLFVAIVAHSPVF